MDQPVNAYAFEDLLAWMESKGQALYGSHFRLQEPDYGLVYQLLVYVFQDEQNASRQGLDLHKGLLLSGPIGCGKTSLMNLLRFFEPANNRFVLKSCREVSFEFIQEGYEVIQRYSQASVHRYSRLPTYCFDDLGAESNLKYYGNECNVMGEILLSRYDLFISRGMKTHLTTNLTSTEIDQYYGNRLRSRMREMFNLVSFDKEARDKRR